MNKANLFIAGPIKSGSTSLNHMLGQHQYIFSPKIKETHFFSDLVSPEKNDLKDELPHSNNIHSFKIFNPKNYDLQYDQKLHYKYFIDASPTYFIDPKAPKKIFDYNPNSIILLIYRNPFERLFSHAKMVKSLRNIDDTITDLINKDYYKNKKTQFADSYFVEYSLYSEAISRFSDYFPKKQLILLGLQNITKGEKGINSLLQFLDLPPFDRKIDLSRKNVDLLLNHRQISILKKLLPVSFLPTKTKEKLKKALISNRQHKKELIIDFLDNNVVDRIIDDEEKISEISEKITRI